MARPQKYKVRTVEDLAHRRWCDMHSRVNTQKRHKHATICPTWFDFNKFKEDMGECPIGFSLDRIDNNLGYNKLNCRWIPVEQQSKNRRNVIILFGKTIKELAETLKVNYKTVWNRINKQGMQPYEALTYRATIKQIAELEKIRDSVNF